MAPIVPLTPVPSNCWAVVAHHEYKSPLAGYVFLRWAPAWLDPTGDLADELIARARESGGQRPTRATSRSPSTARSLRR